MHPPNLPHKLSSFHNIKVEFVPISHSGEFRAWELGEGVEIEAVEGEGDGVEEEGGDDGDE